MIQKKKFSDAIAANISVVGELIGVVSSEKNGLMPKNGFINLGRGINSGNGDGTDIQNGYAYIFDKDDSGLAGPVFAVQPLDGYSLQIKAQADGSRIKIRTLSSNGWGTWREIQLK